jgi:hypothetical protein
MNQEQLKTILWLRWRLMANQWRRTGGLGALITALVAASAGALGAMSFAGTLLGAVFGLGKVSPQIIMLVWLGVTVLFLFFWMIGLLTELQRSETIDLQKLMHLPVALGQMFGINYLVSHFSLSIVIIVPAIFGLGIGLAIARGPEMILLDSARVEHGVDGHGVDLLPARLAGDDDDQSTPPPHGHHGHHHGVCPGLSQAPNLYFNVISTQHIQLRAGHHRGRKPAPAARRARRNAAKR